VEEDGLRFDESHLKGDPSLKIAGAGAAPLKNFPPCQFLRGDIPHFRTQKTTQGVIRMACEVEKASKQEVTWEPRK
jgi:hypothetical protein